VNMDRSRLLLSGQELQEKKRVDDATIANIKSQIEERDVNIEIAKNKAKGSGNFTPQDPGVNSSQNAKIGSGSFYDKIKRNTDLRTSLFQEITAGLGVEYNGQVYNDLYKRDDNTGQMVLNPKYVNTTLGTNLIAAAKKQLPDNITDINSIHLNGDASKIYGDKIKQWFDLGTIIDRQTTAAKNAEVQYDPILGKVLSNANIPNDYNLSITGPDNPLTNLVQGKGLNDWRNINLSKKPNLN